MRETLASLVEDWRQLGDQTALASHRGNRVFRTSYAELARLAGRFAAELDRRGIGPGERVVLWGENSPEWMAAFFGCLLRGVIAVPLDAAGTAAFGARVVAEVSPRLVVGDAPLLAAIPGSASRIALAELGRLLPPEPLFTVSQAVVESAPFQIVFTSGTTSEPKGVVHTHRNVLASLRPIEAEIGRYRRYERWFHPLRFLHTLPFSHVFGQFMGLWIPGLLGAEVHLPERVEPARLIRIARGERVSVLVAVPRVLDLLRVHLGGQFPALSGQLGRSAGIPGWKRWWRFREVHAAFGFKFWAFVCGGATLPPALESFWNGLGFALVQGYGMTETAALVTLNHPFKVGRGTLGKALPGREVRLSAEGEILVRGDMLAAGAWQGGHFRPRAEEWLATGDLGTQDANGELRFAGRRGEVIVTAAGMNVYPQDLEAALLRQPGVRGCAVVGCDVPDGAGGSEPVGIVLFAGDEAGLREATERANAELAAYQQLRRVLRWPEPALPYTSTGKLLRRQVAAWACEQLDHGPRTTKGQPPRDALLRLLEEVTREPVGATDDRSRLTEDLHLDSLGRVQLQAALEERFGIEVRDDRMAAAGTVAELRTLVGMPPEAAGAAISPPEPAMPPRVSATAIRYPRWPWSPPVRWLRAIFLETIAMPLVWLLANPRVLREPAVAPEGPLLLIANHVNTYDLPLLLYALGGRRRRWLTTAMSAEVLADLRTGRGGSAGRTRGNAAFDLLGRLAYWLLLGLFNVFPLPRASGFRDSFAHAGAALDRGFSVLVFPEGRRGWTGELQPFRPGIGLLVESSQVPVLPVALQGMGAAGRKAGSRWFRPPGLAVHIGAPLVFAPGTGAEEITRRLEEAMRALGPS